MIHAAISDLQLPYTHVDAVEFLKEVYAQYTVHKTIIIGDILDQYFANAFGKTPKAISTAEEFSLALEVLHEEIRPIFKHTKEYWIVGNHDRRIHKRADEAGIHSMFLKDLRTIYRCPEGVPFVEDIVLDGIAYVHGDKPTCTEKSAMEVLTNEWDIPVVYGHFVTPSIQYRANRRRTVWGMCVGSLIDYDAYAFDYAKSYKYKPILGIGLVIDGNPVFIEMKLNSNKRWIGKL